MTSATCPPSPRYGPCAARASRAARSPAAAPSARRSRTPPTSSWTGPKESWRSSPPSPASCAGEAPGGRGRPLGLTVEAGQLVAQPAGRWPRGGGGGQCSTALAAFGVGHGERLVQGLGGL